MSDLEFLLRNQLEFAFAKLGRGRKANGLLDHIQSEIEKEIKPDPTDTVEWLDVAILALEGALRCEHENTVSSCHSAPKCRRIAARVVSEKLTEKLMENWHWRKWPPKTDDDKPVEHIRDTAEE